ncbi:hypothetical protein B5F87_14105 [Eubacterium sp. An3]|nr:hypothetical protein B5F87_14105 [Eubacterium sp. An3]
MKKPVLDKNVKKKSRASRQFLPRRSALYGHISCGLFHNIRQSYDNPYCKGKKGNLSTVFAIERK